MSGQRSVVSEKLRFDSWKLTAIKGGSLDEPKRAVLLTGSASFIGGTFVLDLAGGLAPQEDPVTIIRR
jgi:hypothetical protein